MNNVIEFTAIPCSAATLDPYSWVENHAEYLFNYAVGQLRDASAAQDLVQETFLAAWRGLDRFAGKSTERTWLTGILRHKMIDFRRQSSRKQTVPLTTGGERVDGDLSSGAVVFSFEAADPGASPSRRLELAEFGSAFQQALRSLPPRIAEVFELYEIEEKSAADICAAMNISPSNLWVMLHRARKQLRACLQDAWLGAAETSQRAA